MNTFQNIPFAFGAALAITIAGCSGSITPPAPRIASPLQSVHARAAVTLIKATPAPALVTITSPSGIGTPAVQNLAGTPGLAGIRPPSAVHAMLARGMHGTMSQSRQPYSSVPSYDEGGQMGFVAYPKFDDTEAVLTAYDNTTAALPPPPGGSQYPNEIATTVHAGEATVDGTTNCLEIATVYQTYYNQTAAAMLEVGNWCQTQGEETFPVQYNIGDTNFQASYVRDLGNGYPDVQVELYQPIGGDGSWHALLYNFGWNNGQGRWDDLGHWYGDAGYDSTLQYSWDIFETHLYPGPCPTIPDMASFNFEGAVENGNDSQNYFRTIQSGDVNSSLPDNSGGAFCFTDDGFGIGAVYNYSVTSVDSAYHVTDPAGSATCTWDSMGYCAAGGSQVVQSSVMCEKWTAHGYENISVPTKSYIPYKVFNTKQFLENSTRYLTNGVEPSPACTPYNGVVSWSPNEPKVKYNDPSLP